MATVRKRKLPSGRTVFEFSYGSAEKRRCMLFDNELDAKAALNYYNVQTTMHISFEMSVILIQSKPGVWEPKTDERIVPISAMVERILREQWETRRSDKWVFPNRAGKPDGHLLEKMKKICRRAGIPSANLHQLRHSFATHLRMQGTSLADIAELLGHRDLETTQIYAKVQQEHLRSAVSRLSNVISLELPHEAATRPQTTEIENPQVPVRKSGFK